MSLIYSEEKGKALSACPPQCCLVRPVSSLLVPTQAQVQALSAVRLNSIQHKPITFENGNLRPVKVSSGASWRSRAEGV